MKLKEFFENQIDHRSTNQPEFDSVVAKSVRRKGDRLRAVLKGIKPKSTLLTQDLEQVCHTLIRFHRYCKHKCPLGQDKVRYAFTAKQREQLIAAVRRLAVYSTPYSNSQSDQTRDCHKLTGYGHIVKAPGTLIHDFQLSAFMIYFEWILNSDDHSFVYSYQHLSRLVVSDIQLWIKTLREGKELKTQITPNQYIGSVIDRCLYVALSIATQFVLSKFGPPGDMLPTGNLWFAELINCSQSSLDRAVKDNPDALDILGWLDFASAPNAAIENLYLRQKIVLSKLITDAKPGHPKETPAESDCREIDPQHSDNRHWTPPRNLIDL